MNGHHVAQHDMNARFREHIENHDLISFDVFDTLILRAIERPTDAFALVKIKLMATRAALLHPDLVDAFPDLRVHAERSARERKQRESGHDEVTFAEIYAEFARLTGAGDDVIALLERTELATEREVVYANPAVAGLFEYARERGKRIVLVSDMYLPATEVRDLLDRCGYAGYDELYVSCEHARSKHLGTMYDYVAEKHQVAAGRILHIGDNAHGDIVMAERAGCTAYHLPSPAGDATARMPWNGEQHFYPDTVTAIVDGIIRKRAQRAPDADADPWEDLGFRVFGPLFTGFLLWLRVAIEQKRPDRIVLFARDSYFVTAYLERFLAGLGPLPPLDYLYVSRGSLLLPSMTDFPIQRLNHLFSGRAERSVARHLVRLGLDPNVLAHVIRTAGFESADDPVRNGDPRMRTLLGKVQHLLLRESAKRRPIVQAYLEQFIGDAQDLMLIDIGWVGNMQASFVRLLASAHPDLKVRGYYVGVFRSAVDNALPGHSMQGWLTRPGDPERFEQTMWWSGGVELLEFAMTAPHGTTLGYERAADGSVVPIIESNAFEDEAARLAARLQRGAAAFVEEFLASFGDVPADGLNSRAWGAAFHSLVTDPSRADAELLGDLTHSDAAGDSAVRLPLAPKVDGTSSAGDAFGRCYWPAGFVVRNALELDETFDEDFYLALHPDVRAAVDAGRRRVGDAALARARRPRAPHRDVGRLDAPPARAGDGDVTETPVVGIVTRTKNRPVLLKRAIESVLFQTYPTWTMVIVNDGGDPAPIDALVDHYAARADGRIRVIHNPRSLGMEGASAVGLAALESELLTVHDDDDSWSPEFLTVDDRGAAASCSVTIRRCRASRRSAIGSWNTSKDS